MTMTMFGYCVIKHPKKLSKTRNVATNQPVNILVLKRGL